MHQVALDADADGDIDIVVGARSGLFLMINEAGGFAEEDMVQLGGGELFLAKGDLDGDGLEDIIASKDQSGGIRWYRNLGTGAFAEPVEIVAASIANSIVACDLDDDGDLDLVFSLQGGTISWCENLDGEGDMAAPAILIPTAVADHVQAVDLNGDQLPELVFGHASGGSAGYARNLGSASFAAPQPFPEGNSVFAADLDSDGLPDIITSSHALGTLHWHKFLRLDIDGVPEFGEPVLIAEDMAFAGIPSARDIDLDGTVDLLLTHRQPDGVYWLSNLDGLADFGTPQMLGYGLPIPRYIAFADVDGDGDEEVFTSTHFENNWIWYENISTASYMISGRVFHDIDGDGSFNGIDHGLAGQLVLLGTEMSTFTNSAGFYHFPVTQGEYTIEHVEIPGWTRINAPSVFHRTITGMDNVSTDNDFAYQPSGPMPSVEPVLVPGHQRCSTTIPYWITARNHGNQPGELRVELRIDERSVFVDAEPAPAAVQPGLVVWEFSNVMPTHARQVRAHVAMPDWEHMGDVLVDSLVVKLMDGQAEVARTGAANRGMLTCAYDPNDKLVFPIGEGEEHLTPMGQALTYTIRFQNTGNDTAFVVVLEDLIQEGLDRTSLRILAASHHMRSLMDRDGLMRMEFPNIMLPDSNVNEPRSHGFVRFSIAPMDDMEPGTVVENTAGIFFDLNPAIITNTVFNTFSEGVTSVQPNDGPREDQLSIHPNPFTENAMIDLHGWEGRVRVQLFNTAGQVMRDETVQGGATVIMQRSGLASGMYLMRALPLDMQAPARMARVMVD